MTTEAMFEMLHGMAVDALEHMEAERDTLRARAEAAEQRAETLAAELAQARAEGEAAGAVRERAAVVAYYSARAARMRAEGDAASGAASRFYAYAEAQDAERVARAVEAGEHVGAAGTAP